MVGGTVIENIPVPLEQGVRRRLWVTDPRGREGECRVYCDIKGGKDVRPGDRIWWQGGTIYWTRDIADGEYEFVDREIDKVGFSF